MLRRDPTFLGVPFATDAAEAPGAVRAALGWYGADTARWDFDAGGPLLGGATVVDLGDVPGDLHDGAANRAAISAAIGRTLIAGAVPLVLGGDDSVPIPVLEAYDGHPGLTVVQVDAHIDWRHEVDGVTHGFSSTMRRASEMDHVKRIVQVGARGPGSARAEEVEAARAWGAVLHTARDVHAQGVAPALEAVPEGADVFLAIDVDGIDPSVVPGVILPAFGGLTYQQVLDVILGVAARGRIVGVDFVEYVPSKDPAGSGAKAIARLASVAVSAIMQGRR
ncbi:agmatinase [Thalassobaculum fulvum]|uniref:Agmatinase n=1 Tax=Thalassobaculum fulvum TaxID=1633335 RepID=A0A919CRS2_9PROT|nr:arginase family protein [Thalassobaculum fulvum]GHD59349.1 agmatinase [Thalassobaculum fulvum]